MILNPNCSEWVSRLEIVISVGKLNSSEVDTLQETIENVTTDFNYDKSGKNILIYDYDSFYGMEDDLKKLPFWGLVDYKEETRQSYE